MKSRHLLAPALGIGCLLVIAGLCPASLFAQEKPRAASSRPAAAETPASTRYDIEVVDGHLLLESLKGRIDVNAKWGPGSISRVEATLRNIVEVLRELHKEANLVMSPGIERIRISDLKLRAATLDQELDALRVASGQKFIWSGKSGPATIDAATGLPVASRMEGRSPLYILSESAETPETRRRVEVFNLSDYFNSLDPDAGSRQKLVEKSLDDIKRIVVTTIEAVEPESAAVSFQFHSGANLLVVIGTPEALEISRRVINALQTPAGLGTPGFAGGFQGGNPAPVNSKNYRDLISRLETIRLESVLYDTLPLSEVVGRLIDVTRKRDPEKKGINFLINPNSPALAAVPAGVDPATGLMVAAPASEPMDINQITVKINPALTNMRLVDVLDAIVRVADHPIKYTVTDYAVVFSMRSPDEPFGLAQPGIR